MQFTETRLAGAWLIEPTPNLDERGYFMRTFCMAEYARHRLETAFVQHNVSYSARRGTLRGMHYQCHPHAEVKVVTCVRGAIFDVIVDVRDGSPSFGAWQGFELSSANRRQLYIPTGFAHGFQTLSDDAEVAYLMSEFHAPLAAAGFRYDDPEVAIQWPVPVTVLSPRDAALPRLADAPPSGQPIRHPHTPKRRPRAGQGAAGGAPRRTTPARAGRTP